MKRIRDDPFRVFQLDATAYPGNSGSPVYDPMTGAVIETKAARAAIGIEIFGIKRLRFICVLLFGGVWVRCRRVSPSTHTLR